MYVVIGTKIAIAKKPRKPSENVHYWIQKGVNDDEDIFFIDNNGAYFVHEDQLEVIE